MSHYERNYTKMIDDVAERERVALDDVKHWLGEEKFEEVTGLFRTEVPPIGPGKFRFYCGIAGIQGYPVAIWWKHCFGCAMLEEVARETG